jgi:hypothetical protein
MGKKKISILRTPIFRGIILTLLFGVIAFIIWLVARSSTPSPSPPAPSTPAPSPPAPSPSPPQPKGNLADQLYNAGVRMFGAGECPHTQQQLKNLGYNVQNPINPATAPKFYVQCSESLNVDNLSQIKGECISLFQTCSGTTCNYHAQYPTWQFGVGGKVISGILPIDVLMNFISKNRDKNYTVQSISSTPLEER